jgi:uncharacterized protein YjiK
LLAFCGVLFAECDKSNSADSSSLDSKLVLVSEKTLPFAEPSGIAYSEKLNRLWVVSGGDQQIYMLDTAGDVEKKLHFTGIDLEGIAFDGTDSTLWVIDEATKDISQLDLDGKVLFQKSLTYSSTFNKGPEGITIGKDHRIHILNERDPSVLYELDDSLEIANAYQLDFASDYSDVSYDSSSDSFFILSDESDAFFVWNKKQGVSEKYVLPTDKNEGLAFDRKRNLFYIVNDATAKFTIYAKK